MIKTVNYCNSANNEITELPEYKILSFENEYYLQADNGKCLTFGTISYLLTPRGKFNSTWNNDNNVRQIQLMSFIQNKFKCKMKCFDGSSILFFEEKELAIKIVDWLNGVKVMSDMAGTIDWEK